MLRTAFKKALKELNLNLSSLNTHSFRIAAATSAKQAGIRDSHLKTMGKWRSDAYLKYVRVSLQDMAKLSKTLASTS